MADARTPEPAMGGLLALGGWRLRQLRNIIDQQLREAAGRTLLAIAMLALIWYALFALLDYAFNRISTLGPIGLVADEHLFAHFFLALAIMLAFSNAILAFSSLYGRDEAGHLLSMPVPARHVVIVKWAEGIGLSSWSFLLLGVPMMMAVATHSRAEWWFYPLFLMHFSLFVIIPAGVGLIGAWVVAMFAPRRPLAAGVLIGTLVMIPIVTWVRGVLDTPGDSDAWIRNLLEHLAVVKHPFVATTWTAKGISAALNREYADSQFYLLVVAGNAFFVSWVVVNVLGRTWPEAFNRVQNGRLQTVIKRAWFTWLIANVMFFYLPPTARRIMLKDLRGFTRDARQWSQMLIMFGLLVIYALNLNRLPLELHQEFTQGLIAFLNLTTVSLIVATFTTRFIYPLLSLESQQLWLLELLPIRRSTILLVKFVFALTVTGLAACGVMALSVYALGLPPLWVRIHLSLAMAICVGLSGLAIGLGARFPVLTQRNPARIASGFGGTINLIASVLFVSVEMVGVALLSIREFRTDYDLPENLSWEGWLTLAALFVVAAGVAAGSLIAGARHFARLET